MKIWARRYLAPLVVAGLALAASPALADVAALLDDNGNYLRTEIQSVRRGRLTSVWLGSRTRSFARNSRLQRVILNESGAFRGDGVPSVANHPLSGLPWAIWSFNEDGDYEIAVSIFDGRDWTSPVLLGSAPNGAGDLEPKLIFTSTGRPIVVWWRQSADGAQQSIWLTARIDGLWRLPTLISSSRSQSSRPGLLLRGEELIIAYQNASGTQIRTVPTSSPLLGGNSSSGGDDGPDPPTSGDTRPPECQLFGCDGD